MEAERNRQVENLAHDGGWMKVQAKGRIPGLPEGDDRWGGPDAPAKNYYCLFTDHFLRILDDLVGPSGLI